MFTINTDFEGANCKVLSVNGDEVLLDVELRDTQGDWFFWCFQVCGAAGRKITFHFANPYRVGHFGAAVSYDFKAWRWQSAERNTDGQSFTYEFGEDENEVYFAHDMVYRPERFFRFAERLGLKVETLCISERGREVPYFTFGEGENILLTARHHACESTGSYVLEGVIEELLARGLDKKYRVFCVPFVDYDGVVDGDQGKNRNGHDHNRDYGEDKPAVYASVAKIREYVEGHDLKFAFDFHSPWHWAGRNDKVFIPIPNERIWANITRFSKLLEKEITPNALPYFAADEMPPDVEWNHSDTPCCSVYMSKTSAELAFSFETTYFLATDTAFTAERGVETGRCFARALEKYDE